MTKIVDQLWQFTVYCTTVCTRCLFIGWETAFSQSVMLDSWNFAALTFNSIIVFSYCSWYFFTFNRSSCPLLYSFPFLKILVSLSIHFYKVNMFLWEAFGQKCSVKKVFLEIWQNRQENNCVRVSFLKLQASGLSWEIGKTPEIGKMTENFAKVTK